MPSRSTVPSTTTTSSSPLPSLLPPLLIFPPLFLLSCMTLQLTRQSSTILATSILSIMFLSTIIKRVRYYTRVTAFLLGLATCSSWGVIVSIIMSLAGRSKDINWVVARSFHGLVAPLVGMRFTVEGEEHLEENKPGVVLGNHQTMIDILYLGRIFPKGCSIMAKKELQWTPLLGQFMTLSNAVFVNRSNRSNAVATFAKVATTMKERVLSLFIFPEGTRSASPVPSMLPFKKGAFHLAVAAQLPIIPIVCENYAAAYSAKNKSFEGGDLIIRVLPPIPTIGITSSSEDITALVDKTRNAMLEAIEDLGRRREEINRLKGVFSPEEREREPRESLETTPLVGGENGGR